MERILIIIGVILAGVVTANFSMQLLVDDSTGWRRQMTPEGIEQELMVQPLAPVYRTIADVFPEEYAGHLKDLDKLVGNRSIPMERMGLRITEASRAFFEELQDANAFYIAQAPRDALEEVLAVRLEILEAAAEDATLCARLAAKTSAETSRADLAQLDATFLDRRLVALFQAIAAGRDRPAPHGAPDQADWAAFLNGMIDEPAETRAAVRAFLDGDTSDNRRYCDGARTYTRQMIRDGSDGSTRILAEMVHLEATR